MGIGGSLLVEKQLGREAEHSLPSTSDVENGNISIPLNNVTLYNWNIILLAVSHAINEECYPHIKHVPSNSEVEGTNEPLNGPQWVIYHHI
jgi:hypothetical protein